MRTLRKPSLFDFQKLFRNLIRNHSDGHGHFIQHQIDDEQRPYKWPFDEVVGDRGLVREETTYFRDVCLKDHKIRPAPYNTGPF